MIIALAGFIGSGKDTVGRYFVEEHGYQDMAFADALKDTCAAIFCWDREMLDGKNPQSRAWRNIVDPWWAKRLGIPDFTPRRAMQLIGTDTMRRYFNDDLWIMNVERRIEEQRRVSNAPIVITDGRFPNELKLVQDMGGKVLRVKRGDEPEWFQTALIANTDTDPYEREQAALLMGLHDVHKSEWAWIGYPMDIIENDSTLDALFTKAEAFIKGTE